jgi:hemerythrin-like domain-containing protein
MHAAVDVIAQEHRSITAVVNALESLARDVAGGKDPDYEVLTVILDYIETFPNWLHHPKEDRYLFSALRRRIAEWTAIDSSLAATQVLDQLEADHQRENELTRELRYLLTRCRIGGASARQAFAEAVERYARFHWEHMRKEEDVVLPLALEALTAADWTVIDTAFSRTDESIPGVAPRQEFDALFRLIVAMTSPRADAAAGHSRRGEDRMPGAAV